MKTKNNITAMAGTALTVLTLTACLSVFTPAYAISSVSVSDENPAGAGDTFDETAPAPAYADEAVNGILSSSASEQTVVYVTQESPASAPVAAPAPAQIIKTVYVPMETPEPVAAETAPAPEISAITSPEPTQGTGQVLGVANEQSNLDVYYSDLKLLLKTLQEQQSGLQNFLMIGLLMFMIVIPLMAGNLIFQNKLFKSTATVVKKLKTTATKNSRHKN